VAHPARRLHQRLETVHAVTYFAEESREAAAGIGLKGFWMGYFGFRAAPLGAVGPAVVEAVFANFAPRRVRKALPDAWSYASPEDCLHARRTSAVASIERLAGPEAAEIAPRVVGRLDQIVEEADHLGRPLFAANREQPRPDEPVAALWQLATCLREQRGDGHVAVQASSGLDPVEMHLVYAAGSGFPGELLRTTRDWTEEEWAAGVERLRGRGLLVDATTPTDEGRALHDHIEATTDELAARNLGDVDDLIDALTPLARAISASGVLPFPNPIGLAQN
jgi:Helix-turn-helix family